MAQHSCVVRTRVVSSIIVPLGPPDRDSIRVRPSIRQSWDRLAQTCGEFLGKGQQVAVEGRIQTRSWDDDRGQRHWKTEIVASHVEMLSGRRKKDYAAESAANGLAAQAAAYVELEADEDEAAAIAAASEPIAEAEETVVAG